MEHARAYLEYKAYHNVNKVLLILKMNFYSLSYDNLNY